MTTSRYLASLGAFGSGPVCPFPHGKGPRGAQTVKIVRRSTCHVSKLLASSAPPDEVEGIYLEGWLVVADSYYFGGYGASFDV